MSAGPVPLAASLLGWQTTAFSLCPHQISPLVGVSVLVSSSYKDISHFGLVVVQSLSHVQLFVTP